MPAQDTAHEPGATAPPGRMQMLDRFRRSAARALVLLLAAVGGFAVNFL